MDKEQNIDGTVVDILAPVMKKHGLLGITATYTAGGDSMDGYEMSFTSKDGVELDIDAIISDIEQQSSGNPMFLPDFIDENAPSGFEQDDGSNGEVNLVYDPERDVFTLSLENTVLKNDSFGRRGTLDVTTVAAKDQKFVQAMVDELKAKNCANLVVTVSDIDSDESLVFSTNPPLEHPKTLTVTSGFIRAVLRDVMGQDYELELTDNIDITVSVAIKDSVPVIRYEVSIEKDTIPLDTEYCFEKSYSGKDIPALQQKTKTAVKP